VRAPRALIFHRGCGSRFVIAVAALAAGTCADAAGITFRVVEATGRPVADAVVALYPLDAPVPAADPGESVVIEQRDLQFHPFVTALRVGSSAVLPNNEKRVEHHVYSSSDAKKFEFPLYKPGKAETVVFDRPGLVVMGCNIHDSMLAYVLVLETPWFARTGEDGLAVFANLPPGRWRAETWHPRLKGALKGTAVALREEVNLASAGAGSTRPVTLKLEPDRRIRRGPATRGAGYK
jgi:plastocyanin